MITSDKFCENQKKIAIKIELFELINKLKKVKPKRQVGK